MTRLQGAEMKMRVCVKGWLAAIGMTAALAPGAARAQITVQHQLSRFPEVTGTVYSPDGTEVAAVEPGDVQIYSASTGQLLQVLWTGVNENTAAFSPDGKTLAVGGNDLELWDLTSGVQIAGLKTNLVAIASIGFSTDGNTLANAGFNAIGSDLTTPGIELWNVSSKSMIANLPTKCSSSVKALLFLPDGKSLADFGAGVDNGNPTGEYEVWNASTGAPIQSNVLPGANANFITAGAISPDGKMVAADVDSQLEVWSTSTFTTIESITAQFNTFTAIAFSPDSSTVAGISDLGSANPNTGALNLWQVSSGKLLYSAPVSSTRPMGLGFSPDGKTVAVGGLVEPVAQADYGSLEYLNAATGQPVMSFETNSPTASAAYSPDGKTVVWVGDVASALTLWNPTSQTPTVVPISTNPTCVAYSPSGVLIADGGQQGESGVAEIRNSSTGALVRSFPTTAKAIDSVAFSSDGTLLVVAGVGLRGVSHAIGVLEVWQVATGKLMASFNSAAGMGIQSVAFSPDGTKVADAGASTAGGVVELWSLESHTRLQSFQTVIDQISSVIFSPNGAEVIDGGNFTDVNGLAHHTIEVWEASNGDLITTGGISQPVSCLAVTPDGNDLFVDTNQSVYALDLPNLQPIWSYPTSLLSGLQFIHVSADGTQFCFGNNVNLETAANPFYNSVGVSYLILNPATVLGGEKSTGTVTLTKAAPSAGQIVYLYSGAADASIPASVTVPAGAKSATFSISTTAEDGVISISIYASSGGPYANATITILPALKYVSVNPGSVIGGQAITGTATLSEAAGPAGVTLNLKSNSSSALVPASVFVPAGATSANFTINTKTVATSVNATVSASEGSVTVTSEPFTIIQPPLARIEVTTPSVVGGSTTSVFGQVFLTTAQPIDTVITLSSSNPSAATIPNEIVVPAGAEVGTFSITPQFTTSAVTDIITASYPGKNCNTSLVVLPLQMSTLTLSASSVSGGTSVTGTVTLNATVSSATVVKLTTNSSALTIPATVTIPVGQSSATFTINTTSVTKSTVGSVAASLGTSAKSAKITVTP